MKRSSILSVFALFLFACFTLPNAGAASSSFGDGVTDSTDKLQKMLNDAGQAGGEVALPAGQYVIRGHITVPKGVTLRGSWDAPHHGSVWDKGTTLLIYAGRGSEDGAAIDLEDSSAIDGITMLWPEQMWNNIVPYPWAIRGLAHHATVKNLTLVNAYQGIKMGEKDGSLHLIRDVYGCVLRRGILIDKTSDIGRIENVHFNPHYWLGSGHPSSNLGAKSISSGGDRENSQRVHEYLATNLEGFIFGRTDWEYVFNTFLWGAHYGYRFIKTASGNCNGQFMGIGADWCKACVQIDDIQSVGLQVSNGEFCPFAGDPNTGVVTAPGAVGAAQFVNCNFWGIANHAGWLQGDTAVTFANCHIVDVPKGGAVLAEHGKLIVQGCTFDHPGPAVILKPGVVAATIFGNLQEGGLQVENEIGAHAHIGLNETP